MARTVRPKAIRRLLLIGMEEENLERHLRRVLRVKDPPLRIPPGGFDSSVYPMGFGDPGRSR